MNLIFYLFVLIFAKECKKNTMECLGKLLRTCTEDGYWNEMPCPENTICSKKAGSISCKKKDNDEQENGISTAISKNISEGNESSEENKEALPKQSKKKKKKQPSEESESENGKSKEKVVTVTVTSKGKKDESTNPATVTKVPTEIDFEMAQSSQPSQTGKFFLKRNPQAMNQQSPGSIEYQASPQMASTPNVGATAPGGIQPQNNQPASNAPMANPAIGGSPTPTPSQAPSGTGGTAPTPSTEQAPSPAQAPNANAAPSPSSPSSAGTPSPSPSSAPAAEASPAPSQAPSSSAGSAPAPSAEQAPAPTPSPAPSPAATPAPAAEPTPSPSPSSSPTPAPSADKPSPSPSPSPSPAQKPEAGAKPSSEPSKPESGGGADQKGGQQPSGSGGSSGSSSSSGGGGGGSITADQLTKAMKAEGFQPKPEYIAAVIKEVNAKYKDKEMVAMMLAQFAHESGGFAHIEEIACKNNACKGKYDTNGAPGKTYHGRGFIQLTWPDNYKAASKDLGMGDKLWQDPDQIVKNLDLAVKTSMWYWDKRVLTAPGVKDKKQFGLTTKAINGPIECGKGSNPQAEKRYKLYKAIAKEMGVTNLAANTGC